MLPDTWLYFVQIIIRKSSILHYNYQINDDDF